MNLDTCFILGLNGIEKKPLVLVVDSNIDNLYLTIEVLKSRDCSPIAATNGKEALYMAEQYQPNLILLELMLTGIDGIDIIRHLRQNGNTVPIIAVTSLVTHGHRKRAFLAGCNEYVNKPYEIDQLETTVSRYLEPESSLFSLCKSTPDLEHESDFSSPQ